MKEKTIWIINEYAGSPYHGMEFRHYYIGRELIKRGYNVVIITASYSHLFKNPPSIKEKYNLEDIDGIKYLWIKVPKYNESQDKKRVLKWLVFTSKLYFLPLNLLPKPDLIILSPMQTLPIFPVYRLAKKYGAKLIFEVKDIWPLTLIELGGYSPNHPFIKLLSFAESFAIKRSDIIFSVLPGYGSYLKERGYDKDFKYLPNGIFLEEMNNAEPLDKAIEYKIPKDRFIVGYTGTVGLANSLDSFVEAGKILKDYEKIAFLIVGEGSEKERLIRKSRGNENIIFLPAVPKKQVQSLLQKFDICFISLQSKDLFKFGVSPNKIFDYMYSGKPILEAINTPESLVKKANCGIQVEAENSKAIAEGIMKFYNMSNEERIRLGANGKKYVLENHTFDKLASKIESLF